MTDTKEQFFKIFYIGFTNKILIKNKVVEYLDEFDNDLLNIFAKKIKIQNLENVEFDNNLNKLKNNKANNKKSTSSSITVDDALQGIFIIDENDDSNKRKKLYYDDLEKVENVDLILSKKQKNITYTINYSYATKVINLEIKEEIKNGESIIKKLNCGYITYIKNENHRLIGPYIEEANLNKTLIRMVTSLSLNIEENFEKDDNLLSQNHKEIIKLKTKNNNYHLTCIKKDNGVIEVNEINNKHGLITDVSFPLINGNTYNYNSSSSHTYDINDTAVITRSSKFLKEFDVKADEFTILAQLVEKTNINKIYNSNFELVDYKINGTPIMLELFGDFENSQDKKFYIRPIKTSNKRDLNFKDNIKEIDEDIAKSILDKKIDINKTKIPLKNKNIQGIREA